MALRTVIEVKGRKVAVEDGYLVDFSDWDRDLAEWLAAEDAEMGDKKYGIKEMTSDHWTVIEIIQEYYSEYKTFPMIKGLVSFMREKLGLEKGNTKYLYELFPKGPGQQARKIAGLPRPSDCCCSCS